jgi:hypothetical protein
MSSKGLEGERRLVFASIVDPKRSSSERNALLLVESIRAFAGSLSGAPVWCFTPEHGGQVSATLRDRLDALDVTLIPFEMDPGVAAFRFTGEASAAALAESRADGRVECLAWLNANSLVLREPREFLLPEGKSLGYRPVHHTNIGSRYSETLDPFWTLIYGYCDVPEERVFPMRTHVDGEVIRPYFNAGCHATRPGKGLLRAWLDVYLTVYDEADLKEFYGRDRRYEVFVHQAIFSGVILSRLSGEEACELPPTYNYPVHLHGEDVTDRRPVGMEENVTLRHEGFYEDPDWRDKMPAGELLKRWIAERLLPIEP